MLFPDLHPARRQRGAATAAFAVAAMPVLLCALLAIEGARWHITRQMLHLALLEAARAGATAHARPAVIEQAFETALLPLFQPPGAYDGPRARMRASFLAVTQQTGAPPWRIDVLSPTPDAYADFGDAALRVPGATGRAAINNDYQAEQHLRRRRMGWPGGRGPRSGQTIFQANTLRLRLAYAHPPMVPGLRAVLRQLAAMRGARDATARSGMLVIAMELDLPMQSHPVQWQAYAAGRRDPKRRAVFRLAQDRIGKPSGPDGEHTAPAVREGAAAGHRQTDDAASRAAVRTNAGRRAGAHGTDGRARGETPAGSGNAPERGSEPRADDALCGVVLCCARSTS